MLASSSSSTSVSSSSSSSVRLFFRSLCRCLLLCKSSWLCVLLFPSSIWSSPVSCLLWFFFALPSSRHHDRVAFIMIEWFWQTVAASSHDDDDDDQLFSLFFWYKVFLLCLFVSGDEYRRDYCNFVERIEIDSLETLTWSHGHIICVKRLRRICRIKCYVFNYTFDSEPGAKYIAYNPLNPSIFLHKSLLFLLVFGDDYRQDYCTCAKRIEILLLKALTWSWTSFHQDKAKNLLDRVLCFGTFDSEAPPLRKGWLHHHLHKSQTKNIATYASTFFWMRDTSQFWILDRKYLIIWLGGRKP